MFIATQLPTKFKTVAGGSRHCLTPVRALLHEQHQTRWWMASLAACLNSIPSLGDKNVLRVCLGRLMNIPSQLGKAHRGMLHKQALRKLTPLCARWWDQLERMWLPIQEHWLFSNVVFLFLFGFVCCVRHLNPHFQSEFCTCEKLNYISIYLVNNYFKSCQTIPPKNFYEAETLYEIKN